ncbi:ribokinase [Chloroflexia bacterium SDU3-3]|nr:ribokinase [Chloroflexia bacterium SDU3-3]
MSPEYLLLGHLTRDLLPDGSTAPGGTSLYAALTAHRLGKAVGVVSAAAPLPAAWPSSIPVAHTASPTAPTFENRYTGGSRSQVLHAEAQAIQPHDVPTAWQDAPIIHLAPVLAEVPEPLALSFPSAFLGVTPQGWMRTWQQPLPSAIRYVPWSPSATLLRRINALVLSIEDVQGDEQQVADYAAECPIVALTHGAQGATLFLEGQPVHIAAFPAEERDPTGAGDVFAATLFCALQAGRPPIQAAHEAARIAAASVEAIGASGLLSLSI